MAVKKFFSLEFQGGADTIKKLADVELKLKDISKELAEAKKLGKDNVYKDLRVQQEDLKKSAVDLRAELKKQVRDFETLKLPTGSLQAMRKEYGNLINEISLFTAEQRKSSEGLEKIRLAGALKNDILEVDQAMGNFFSNIGNYKSVFDALLPGLSDFGDRLTNIGSVLSGFSNNKASIDLDIPEIPEGSAGAFELIKNGANGALTAVKALFATPIGWILAITAGIGLAAKEWSEYNKNIFEARKLTEDITGLTGESAVAIRSQALAISEVTGTELTENLNAAKTAVNNFGVDYSEALDIIGEGLINAGNKSDIFLESITEYSTFFGTAGFSFQEFADIINSGIDLGIYTDKLPDALKEFNISILEQTKASRDALENAFGRKFTDDLLTGIKTESISVKDALFSISQEAERIGINSQQAAQLTADLFRGAGEDAGGALAVFEAVNNALSDQPKLLNDIQKGQLQSIDITNRLNKAQADALETESYFRFKQFVTNTWKELQIAWYNFIANFVDGAKIIYENLVIGIAGWQGLFKGIPIAFEVVKQSLFQAFKQIGTAASQLGDVIGKAFTLDFDGAKKSFGDFKKTINDTGSTISSIGSKVNKALTDSVLGSKAKARESLEENKKVLLAQREYEEKQSKLKNEKLSQEEKDRIKKDKAQFEKESKDREKFIEDQEKRIADTRKRISELASKSIADQFDKEIREATLSSTELLNKLGEQQEKLNEKINSQGGVKTSSDIAESELIDQETKAILESLDKQTNEINAKRQDAFDQAKKELVRLQAENLKAISQFEVVQGDNNITNIANTATNEVKKITFEYESNVQSLQAALSQGEITQKEFEQKRLELTKDFSKEKADIEIDASNKVLEEKRRLLNVEIELIKIQKETSNQNINDRLDSGVDKLDEDLKKGLITQQQYYDSLDALRDQANSDRLKANEDASQAEIIAIDEVTKAELDANQVVINSEKEVTEAQKAEIEQRKKNVQELKDASLFVAQTLSDSLFDLRFDSLEREKEKSLELLDEEYSKKAELAQGNATLEESIKNELEAKKLEIEKKAFERNKKIQIAQTLINSALAATAIFAVPDFTFGIATAAKLLALSITTAASIAKIKAQEFNDGGVVQLPSSKEGIINYEPNTKATSRGDNILIKAKKGELILNKNSQSKAESVWPTIWKDLNVPGFADGGFVGASQPNFNGPISMMKIEISDENILIIAKVIAEKTGIAVEAGSMKGSSEGTFFGNTESLRLKERGEKINQNTLI